jgi:DNA-directed RNA polymerase specialized sigma24 family protein
VRELDRAEVQAAWRRLSQRYGWSLVEDEAAFVARAYAECQGLVVNGSAQDWAKVGVWRAYGACLYDGLQASNERAAGELWQLFARLAMHRGYTRALAEELAQDGVVRVLFKLPSLHSPAAMLTWAIRLFSSVLREQAPAVISEPLSDAIAERSLSLMATTDVAVDVEQQLITSELVARLRAQLTNDLEFQSVVRTIVYGDKPRDIARDLDVPAYRIRVAKSRALDHLRQDASLLAWLRELSGDSALALGSSGADDHA